MWDTKSIAFLELNQNQREIQNIKKNFRERKGREENVKMTHCLL